MYIDNPNNPLGRLIDIQELSELVSVANQENVIVIVDKAYADFVDDKQSEQHTWFLVFKTLQFRALSQRGLDLRQLELAICFCLPR